MSFAQVGSLIDFTAGTTIVSADVDSNFSAIRTVVNGLVTGTDTIQAARINPVSGSGLGVNGASLGYALAAIVGSFTSDGSSTGANILNVSGSLTGATGDTTALRQVQIGGSITTQGQTETITVVAGLYVDEPNITVGSGDTVTAAATVYITAAPTEGSSNYALWVDAGDTRLDGGLLMTGAVGVDVNPGSDTDADLITVGVTGAPKLSWDESEDKFVLTKGLAVELVQGTGSQDGFALSDATNITEPYPGGTMATGTFFHVGSFLATDGGTLVRSFAENVLGPSYNLVTFGGTAGTSKGTASKGLIALYAAEHDGSGSLADVAANGNVWSVAGRVGGAERTLFLIDEDGDFHYDGADGGAFDSEDDVALVRAFALATSEDTIRTEFDEFVGYNEDDLVRLGILGDTVDNGGLVNGAQLQRLLVGAIWQQSQRIEELERRLLPS